MYLPSINNSNSMKQNSKVSSNDNQFERNVPQDMFGLGIQVFKIQSKKQISGSAKSVGKARRDIQVIENPIRKTGPIPPVPKSKKTSAILPSITKQLSQKEYKFDTPIKTDSILSRKSVDKPQRLSKPLNEPRMDIIKQYNPPQSINKTALNKSKPGHAANRPANKSADQMPQTQTSINPSALIAKQEWRPSLNILRKFYTQHNEYQINEQTKIGRRKNQQLIGEFSSFVQVYVNNQNQFYQTQAQYDPFSIQNCEITSKSCKLQDKNYEDYVMP